MELNVVEKIRTIVGAAEGSTGPDGVVELRIENVKQLLSVISDQERELLGLERHHESLVAKVQKLIDGLDCYDFSKQIPDDDSDNQVFEVFVGTPENNGRIFAIWDAQESAFYEPLLADEDPVYISDVIFWRYSLPEPDETLDLEG